ncbi:MAG TPA: SH3 domain-containing protein [Noviherbaspirillum sp.]|nr:SH3 domain-containing protein [Noviherbaspirillum sp.]
MKRILLTLGGILVAGVTHAEPALTARAIDLMAQAQSDAAVVASLPEDTRLEVLGRKGAWSEVRTANGQKGWLRMTTLKPVTSAAATPASANPLGALNNLLSSGRTSNTATVTTGVRGLEAQDLENAQANMVELEKMQKFAVDRRAAEAFAQRNKLVPLSLEELPVPVAAPAQNNNPNLLGG